MMTNGVMAVILLYFTEFGIVLGSNYVTIFEDSPLLCVTET